MATLRVVMQLQGEPKPKEVGEFEAPSFQYDKEEASMDFADGLKLSGILKGPTLTTKQFHLVVVEDGIGLNSCRVVRTGAIYGIDHMGWFDVEDD